MKAKRPQPLPILGELELAVLDFCWQLDEHCARKPKASPEANGAEVTAVFAAVGAPRRISLNTVGSALERLHRKGLLTRRKVSHAYRYEPLISRAEFAVRRVADVTSQVAAAGEHTLLAAFVDYVADVNFSKLDELAALIAARRKQGGK